MRGSDASDRKDQIRSIWLILPTYNERSNLEGVVAAAQSALPADSQILIVDDASPDGTGQIADRLAKVHDDVRMLHRTRKEGLGPAYVAGFVEALGGGADLVIQMDADFSHDPHDLPRLIAAAKNADVVIGSRYVPGGGVADWGPLRRAISRGGSIYARAVLGTDVRDLTGGFKAIRRRVLDAIGIDTLTSRGYAFQIETTYRAIKTGFRVVELPIVFRDRHVGRSKMSKAIVLEAAWRVPIMRLRSRRYGGDGR
jgi:dolichol-phosphate mannosyltransferase